jgi:hypothetical protein
MHLNQLKPIKMSNTFTGKIVDSKLIPHVDVVQSIFRIWLKIDQDGQEISIEERGSIEQLKQKFQFTIEGENTYILTGLNGRRCKISQDNNGYYFVDFI